MSRRALWLLFAAFLASPTSGTAQSIRGLVRDAESDILVASAEVTVSRDGAIVARALTDSTGTFMVRLERDGRYWIQASGLGYLPGDSAEVFIENRREMVEVVLLLSAVPLEIEGLTVVARGLDLRHRKTYPGFLERARDALDVGGARVITRDHPVLATAGNVRDVLTWLPTERARCTVVYVDGIRQPLLDVTRLSATGLAGIEYYVSKRDAPIEFRDGGRPCLRSMDWTVLILWRDPIGGGTLPPTPPA